MQSETRIQLVSVLSDYINEGIVADRIYQELRKRQVNVRVSPSRFSFIGEYEPYNKEAGLYADKSIIVDELNKNIQIDKERCSVYVTWFRDTLLSADTVSKLNTLDKPVIVPSEFCLTIMTARGVKCPLYVIPFGVDAVAEDETIDYDMPPEGQRTRYLTKIDPSERDPEGLIESLVSLFEKSGAIFNDAELIIKTDDILPVRVDNPNVKVMSKVIPFQRMKELYQQVDYYISISDVSAWDMNILSAMSYGIPIIAPRFAGNMEYLSDSVGWMIPFEYGYKNGNMVSVFDEDALIDIIRDTTGRRVESKGKAAYGTAKRYTYYDFVERLMDVIS